MFHTKVQLTEICESCPLCVVTQRDRCLSAFARSGPCMALSKQRDTGDTSATVRDLAGEL